jgi:hypothetical protein
VSIAANPALYPSSSYFARSTTISFSAAVTRSSDGLVENGMG